MSIYNARRVTINKHSRIPSKHTSVSSTNNHAARKARERREAARKQDNLSYLRRNTVSAGSKASARHKRGG